MTLIKGEAKTTVSLEDNGFCNGCDFFEEGIALHFCLLYKEKIFMDYRQRNKESRWMNPENKEDVRRNGESPMKRLAKCFEDFPEENASKQFDWPTEFDEYCKRIRNGTKGEQYRLFRKQYYEGENGEGKRKRNVKTN